MIEYEKIVSNGRWNADRVSEEEEEEEEETRTK